MNNITALVTGVGAPGTAGTIYALRHNYENRKFRIIGTDMNPTAVGKHMVDEFYVVSRPEAEIFYLDRIQQIVEKEEVNVIIPQTTRETVLFSKHNHFVSVKNYQVIPVIVSDANAVEIANNKYLLMAQAVFSGVPDPITILAKTHGEFHQAVSKLKGSYIPAKNVVIKPPCSSGQRGFRIIPGKMTSVNEFIKQKPQPMMGFKATYSILSQNDPDFPEMIVQEYLPGEEYTVDVFRIDDDRVVAIPRIRLEIRSGISFRTLTVQSPDLIKYSKDLANKLNLKYCFGFQFKEDKDGIPKIIECNPRIQGTMVASTFVGFNIIYEAVKYILNLKPETDFDNLPPFQGIYFSRYWGGIAVDDTGEHQWRI